MQDPRRLAAAQAALADFPPLPTDGQVIREALSRLVPIAVSDIADRWRRCPERRCRRERCCMAPNMQCLAAARLKIPNIEEANEWLAVKLRAQLLDILLARTLGAEQGGEAVGADRVRDSLSPPRPEEHRLSDASRRKGRPHASRRASSKRSSA